MPQMETVRHDKGGKTVYGWAGTLEQNEDLLCLPARSDEECSCLEDGLELRHSFCFGQYIFFVFLGRLSRICGGARAPCSKSLTSRAARSHATFAVAGARAAH